MTLKIERMFNFIDCSNRILEASPSSNIETSGFARRTALMVFKYAIGSNSLFMCLGNIDYDKYTLKYRGFFLLLS